MRLKTIAAVTATAAVLAGCVTPPIGPTVYSAPGRGKSPAAFQQDDQTCQEYANQRASAEADSANNKAIGSAIIGTALGAGLGAAVGGGRGAGIGAASGAVVGTAVGANQSNRAQWSLQQRYNVTYAECMSARGNSIPASAYPPGYYGPPGPPPGYYGPPPPPPPGYYPPPPPPGY